MDIEEQWINIWADMGVNIEPVDEEEIEALKKFEEQARKLGMIGLLERMRKNIDEPENESPTC